MLIKESERHTVNKAKIFAITLNIILDNGLPYVIVINKYTSERRAVQAYRDIVNCETSWYKELWGTGILRIEHIYYL